MIDENKLIDTINEVISERISNGGTFPSLYAAIGIIVNQPKVGEWIPCSNRLPDKSMCTYDDGLVTVETTEILPNGERATFVEDYMLDKAEFCTPYKVVAWRERPEPYKEGD